MSLVLRAHVAVVALLAAALSPAIAASDGPNRELREQLIVVAQGRRNAPPDAAQDPQVKSSEESPPPDDKQKSKTNPRARGEQSRGEQRASPQGGPPGQPKSEGKRGPKKAADGVGAPDHAPSSERQGTAPKAEFKKETAPSGPLPAAEPSNAQQLKRLKEKQKAEQPKRLEKKQKGEAVGDKPPPQPAVPAPDTAKERAKFRRQEDKGASPLKAEPKAEKAPVEQALPKVEKTPLGVTAPKVGTPAHAPPGAAQGAAPKPKKEEKKEERVERHKQQFEQLKQQRREVVEEGGKRTIIEEPDKRRIIRQDGRITIRHDETERLRKAYGDTRQERRADGTNVTIAIRPGGIQIFTEFDDSGRPLRRYRRGPDGRDHVLFDNRAFYRRVGAGPGWFFDAFLDLLPPVIRIPRERYIVDYETASDDDIYEALSAPPVEEIDHPYSLEEIRQSRYLRDRMRRLDLNTITFDFGSWEVDPDEFSKLERVARIINRILDRNPDEMFMIEGYTDAVGSEEDNLSLSDRRAEAVAEVLSETFGIPPENLVTQGYGEQFLKIETEAPEPLNRRVAVRRITPLLAR